MVCVTVAAQAQTFKTVANFSVNEWIYLFTSESLVQAPNGSLYGTTPSGGGNGVGTVFEVTPAGTLSTVYSFCSQDSPSQCADGEYPQGGLVVGKDGNLYGTTSTWGTNGGGTVFKMTPTGTLTTVYSFCAQSDCTDGDTPETGLVLGKDGSFYGTTTGGGATGTGTIFKLTPAGTLTTLYSFCSKTNCADGYYPTSPLIQASNGDFYGTTYAGGSEGWGTVFRITPTGTFTSLHSFKYSDGAFVYAGLVQATDGDLYGTTLRGGTTNNGTIFKITTAGELTTVYNFCSKAYCTDGNSSQSTLIQGSGGNLYGTTYGGGASYYLGSVFEITTAGTLTTLHSFKGSDGAFPSGGLIQASNGELYGTTTADGAKHGGTVFSVTLP